jgi:hypothetical protein
MKGKLEGTRQKYYSLYIFPSCFGYIWLDYKVEILLCRANPRYRSVPCVSSLLLTQAPPVRIVNAASYARRGVDF